VAVTHEGQQREEGEADRRVEGKSDRRSSTRGYITVD
jgi:hypothetical protein